MGEAEFEKLFELVEEKFTSSDKQDLRDLMWIKMNSAHSSWQYRERKNFLGLPDNQRDGYVPEGVDTEDWVQAVHYWASDDFKKMSKRNKQNRGKVEGKNTCGSRTYGEVAENMRDPLTGKMKSHDEGKIKELVEAGSKLTYKEMVCLASGKALTQSSRRSRRRGKDKYLLRT
ncbi:unnamed protein product [Linum trigynum]|uniref:Transposase n=1 Tax=Linum trigynum TaxID=586398 RepID=A0AAV2FRG2_9ROSI